MPRDPREDQLQLLSPERLSEVPLFAGCTLQQIDYLLAGAATRRLPEGGLLFSAGEPARFVYVVIAGEVRIVLLSPEGTQRILHIAYPGQSIAEAAIFGDALYPAAAEAGPGTELLAIDSRRIRGRLEQDPDFGLRLLAAITTWQSYLVGELRIQKAQSPERRLASYLLALAESAGWQGSGRLPLLKLHLAARVGIEPESLSRALRRLETHGIRSDADVVEIIDRDALRALCSHEPRPAGNPRHRLGL